MLTRRAFTASALATLLATRLRAQAVPGSSDSADLWLNRLTFGATPAARAAFDDLGPEGWLEAQLALPAFDERFEDQISKLMLRIQYPDDSDDVGSWTALDEMRPLATLHADPATLLPLVDWTRAQAWEERVRPANEVIAASLPRAVHAPAQLREVMTQFWHDHFNVHSMKNEYTAIFFPSYDATLRAHALGNAREMLGAVARSPAMLVYLNNDESRASPANENYGRELLELHTLGAGNYVNHLYDRWAQVPTEGGLATGYIDEDVYEVARAFTGWTLGDGRWLAEGREAPMSGAFHYEESWHDPYQKRILGREMAPNRAPMADGDEVLAMLAAHPGTARHICTKIARRLLSDAPSDTLVEAMTQTWAAHIDSPDQIAQILRTLTAHPDFAAPPTKLRRPFEFLAALYRATGAKVASPENGFHWQLARAGWEQHTFPPPNGHPDTAAAWTSGTYLLRLTEIALYAHDDWFGATTSRLAAPGAPTVGDLTRYWSARLSGADDVLPELLGALDVSEGTALDGGEGEQHDLSALAVAFAALTPEFMSR